MPLTLASDKITFNDMTSLSSATPRLNVVNSPTVNLSYNSSTGVLGADATHLLTLINQLSSTLVGSVTTPNNGAAVSFGIQPAGKYRLEYVSGYTFVNSGPLGSAFNATVNCRVTYPIQPTSSGETETFDVSFPATKVDFYQAGNIAITINFIDSTYGDNSGPGITWNLYRIF